MFYFGSYEIGYASILDFDVNTKFIALNIIEFLMDAA